MPAKLTLLLVALIILGSAVVASTIAQSEFGIFSSAQNYPTRADFDRTFAAFVEATSFDSQSAAASRAKLRAVGFKRIKRSQFGEG
jgi:hypothetical protein